MRQVVLELASYHDNFSGYTGVFDITLKPISSNFVNLIIMDSFSYHLNVKLRYLHIAPSRFTSHDYYKLCCFLKFTMSLKELSLICIVDLGMENKTQPQEERNQSPFQSLMRQKFLLVEQANSPLPQSLGQRGRVPTELCGEHILQKDRRKMPYVIHSCHLR